MTTRVSMEYRVSTVTRAKVGPFVSDLSDSQSQLLAEFLAWALHRERGDFAVVAAARCSAADVADLEVDLSWLGDRCRRLPPLPGRSPRLPLFRSPLEGVAAGPLDSVEALRRVLAVLWTWQSERLLLLPWRPTRSTQELADVLDSVSGLREIPECLIAKEGFVALEFFDQAFLEVGLSRTHQDEVATYLGRQGLTEASEDPF